MPRRRRRLAAAKLPRTGIGKITPPEFGASRAIPAKPSPGAGAAARRATPAKPSPRAGMKAPPGRPAGKPTPRAGMTATPSGKPTPRPSTTAPAPRQNRTQPVGSPIRIQTPSQPKLRIAAAPKRTSAIDKPKRPGFRA